MRGVCVLMKEENKFDKAKCVLIQSGTHRKLKLLSVERGVSLQDLVESLLAQAVEAQS